MSSGAGHVEEEEEDWTGVPETPGLTPGHTPGHRRSTGGEVRSARCGSAAWTLYMPILSLRSMERDSLCLACSLTTAGR